MDAHVSVLFGGHYETAIFGHVVVGKTQQQLVWRGIEILIDPKLLQPSPNFAPENHPGLSRLPGGQLC